jgi:hypothetical protein
VAVLCTEGVPLSYHLFHSRVPSVCVHAKAAVFIKVASSPPESVAVVELIRVTLKCSTLYKVYSRAF